MGKTLRRGAAQASSFQAFDDLPSAEPASVIAERSRALSERDVPIQVRVPASLRAALQAAAAAKETSMSALVLAALRRAGYAIPDDKLADKRRRA